MTNVVHAGGENGDKNHEKDEIQHSAHGGGNQNKPAILDPERPEIP